MATTILGEVISTSADTTITGSYTLLNDMTKTVTVAGTGSVILFHANISLDADLADSSGSIGLFIDGSLVTEGMDYVDDIGIEKGSVGLAWWETGLSAGSHTFEVRWKEEQTGIIASTDNERSMQVIEFTGSAVPTILSEITSTSADSTSGTTYVLISGMTTAPTIAGTDSVVAIEAIVTVDTVGGSDTNAFIGLFIDNVLQVEGQTGVDQIDETGNVRLTWWKTGLSAGSHTFELRWKEDSSVDDPKIHTVTQRALQVVEFTGAGKPTILSEITSTTADTTATGSYTVINDMTTSPTIVGTDSLVLVSGGLTFDADASNSSVQSAIFIDNVLQAEQEGFIDDDSFEPQFIGLMWAKTGLSAGSHDFDLRFKEVGQAGAIIATDTQRHLQVVEFAGGAFPQVVGSQLSSRFSNLIDDTVDLPASIASGDLIIVFHYSDGTTTRTFPSPWQELEDTTVSGGTSSIGIFYLIASGGETSVTVTKNITERFTAIAIRISASSWHGTTPPEISTGVTGDSTSPDPDSLNPAGWGIEDTMWIAVMANDNGIVTGFPFADNNLKTTDGTSAGLGAIATTESAVDSIDPSVFTMPTEQWWAGTIAVRPAGVGGVSWFDTNWLNRKKITIDNTKVDANINGFPILISITDTDFTKARADGFDFVITKADGTTVIPYEREKWDDVTGELVLWFKGDILDASDVDFYIYYFRSVQSTDRSDPINVWDTNYKAVYHLHDDFADSTSNNNDGTNDGSTNIGAKIADGQDFDGINDKIDIPEDASLDVGQVTTFSAWINIDNFPVDGEDWLHNIFGDETSGSNLTAMWRIGSQLIESLKARIGLNFNDGADNEIESATDLTLDVDTYITVTTDGTNARFYINGAIDNTVAYTITPTQRTHVWGISSLFNFQAWDGILDEIRYSSGIARTTTWISTEFNNQDSPLTFISFGGEEDAPPANRPIVETTEISNQTSNATSKTDVTSPAGVVADDIVLIFIAIDGDVANPTSSGFATLTSFSEGATEIYVLWKRSAGSEPANYTVNWTGSEQARFMTVRVSGCITTGDPWDVISTGVSNSATVDNVINRLTSTVVDTLALYAVAVDRDRVDDADTITGTGWTEVGTSGSSGGANGVGLIVGQNNMPTAEQVEAGTFDAWASDQNTSRGFNLKPFVPITKTFAVDAILQVTQQKTVTIDAFITTSKIVSVSGQIRNGSRLVVRTSNDDVYAIVRDTTSEVHVLKKNASDFFIQKDSGNSPTGADSDAISCAIDSSNIISITWWDEGVGLRYVTFNTSTDTFGTPETAYTELDAIVAERKVIVTIDANDDPHVAFIDSEDGTFSRQNSWYGNKIGGSWNASVDVATATDTETSGLAFEIFDDLPVVLTETTANGLRVYQGNVLNATSFIEANLLVGSNQVAKTMCQTTDGKIWAKGKTTTTIHRHDPADPWGTWNTEILPTNTYSDGSLVANGNSVYFFYKDFSSNDIEVVTNDTGPWVITSLKVGSFNNPKAKWSQYNNNKGDEQIDYLYEDGDIIRWDKFGLVVTREKTFTVNAILVNRFTKDISIDGFLKALATQKTFTIDAEIISGVTERTKTFTINANIKSIVEFEFTVDAIVVDRFDKTVTIDSIVVDRFDSDFTIDAFVLEETPINFTIDAYVQALDTKDFEVDSFIQLLDIDLDFTIDSIVVDRFDSNFTIDSIVVDRFDSDFTIDSIVVDRFDSNFTIDSIVVDRFDSNFTIDAFVLEETPLNYTVDAYVQALDTKDFDVDSFIQLLDISEDFTIDSIVVDRFDSDFTIDSIVVDRFDSDFTIDSIIVIEFIILDFTIDSVIIGTLDANFDVDAIIRGQLGSPDEDISNAGGWQDKTFGNNDLALWDEIDEIIPDDLTTAIRSPSTPTTAQTFEVGLTDLTDPLVSSGHQIQVRARALNGTNQLGFHVELYQGAVLKATSPRFIPTSSFQTFTYQLSAGEIDSITNYKDLRVRIIPATIHQFTIDAELITL